MLIAPYQVDVPMARWPIANFLIIGFTLMVFFGIRAGMFLPQDITPFVLQLRQPSGIPGHMFLHFGWMHILGNMLFLWTYGNAICAKLGNVTYLLVYVLLGCTSGVVHLLVDGQPAIGASGAINGIVGMFLVYYPRNDVSFFILIPPRTFQISSVWLILFWLVFDIWGASQGSEGQRVAYWAHLGGFGAGFLLAAALLYMGIVRMGPSEQSLFDRS